MTEAWHALDSVSVLAHMKSQEEGLTDEEAAVRLQRYGVNRMPSAESVSLWRLLLRQIASPLSYMLLLAAVAALCLHRISDGVVVLSVVMINVLIGFVQEWKAHRAISSLSDLLPERATILRSGERVSVLAEKLVPGDLLVLQAGDRVAADARLVRSKGLRTHEASLTGESMAIDKRSAPLAADTALGDRCNMVYEGTFVVNGTGIAVVIATGKETELHRIALLLSKAAPLETPLTRQFQQVAHGMTWAIVVTSVLLLGVILWQGKTWGDGLLMAVTLAVAAIPEGLPAIITIALAMGVRRMAGRRAILRELPAVETLGCTTVICTDKTGTLTQGEMVVATLLPAHSQPELLRAACLANDATLTQGDPMEIALLRAAQETSMSWHEWRHMWPRIDEIPFDSEHAFMATLHRNAAGKTLLCMKGAPEVVARYCAGKMEIEPEIERLARQGYRLLGCASGYVDLDRLHMDRMPPLIWQGMMGLIDPPRPEVLQAVQRCHRAGIHIRMITGDHKSTAEAIGREVGILSGKDSAQKQESIEGRELAHLKGASLDRALRTNLVFARVSSEQKLQLVRALQNAGHVVAMTGDGVNDAPALKQADLGIAMGIAGTAVAKDASDLILMDDNFATIAAAVEEGRRVYDNLVKALVFILPTNLGLAFILIAGALFFPTVMPMLPIQVLWINLVATIALALPLGFEAPEPDLMQRPPRDANRSLLGPFVLFRTFSVACWMALSALFFFAWEGEGVLPSYVQTMAVMTVIFFQIFYLLTCRSLRHSFRTLGLWTNPSIYMGIGTILALQWVYLYVPFFQQLFSSYPLNWISWLQACGVGIWIVPVVMCEKVLLMKKKFFGKEKNEQG